MYPRRRVFEIALISLLVLFAAFAARLLRDAGAVAHWVIGWSASAIGGAIPAALPNLPHLQLLAYPLGTLFAALLLSGALLFAQRPVPSWWLPGALGFGLVRAAVALQLGPSAGYVLGLLCEPAAVFTAAVVAFRATRSAEASRAERLLAPALVAVGTTGVFHLLWLTAGRPILDIVPLWLFVAPPVLGIQIHAAAQRERRALRHALEERVAARTRELAESEERYRVISELASDLAFKLRVDRRGHLELVWSAGALKDTLGWRREDIVGLGWLRLLELGAREEMIAEYYRSTGAGEPVVLERELIGRDGRGRWIRLRLGKVTVDAEGAVEVLGSARDVSALKAAEQERERLARHVEQVQRLESLGVLAGGIAHDFNNLLTVIRGSAQLALADLASDAPARARVERIAEAAQHAASLTDQMLAYAGKSSPEREPLDLGALVASMADLLRASVPARCKLVFQRDANGPTIEGDGNNLRQVLLNLVLNAADASGESGGRIVVRTGTTSIGSHNLRHAFGNWELPPGEVAELCVRDKGSGMDAETARRIFEPFFSTKFSGRGLGMAAVLGIVQAHRGAICIDTELGRGTSIRVWFPPSTRQPETGEERERTSRTATGGTVLVIDDDPAICELAAVVLGRAGFRAVCAHGGYQALDCLRDLGPDRVDAVLLDLAMPDMSGEEAFLRLRELRSDLPVILVTGYDAARSAERFAARGLDGFLRKPWEPEDLAASVRRVIAR